MFEKAQQKRGMDLDLEDRCITDVSLINARRKLTVSSDCQMFFSLNCWEVMNI